MELSPLIKGFSTGNFGRFLRRKQIEQFVFGLKVFFVLVIFILLVIMVREGLNNSLQANTTVERLNNEIVQLTSASRSTEQISRPLSDYKEIADRNIFNVVKPSVQPVATPAPVRAETRTPLELIGTFVSSADSSYAIIENKQQRIQEVFDIKDDIFGEGTVHDIFADRVEIMRNGEIEILSFDDTARASQGPSAAAAGPADEQFVVDEAELNEALDNLPMLLTQARAVPFFQDGQAVGLRLFAIRSGSLYEKIGLRNGDILKSINGNSMADLSQAMRLFEELKQQRSISLTLERNRQERQFRYEIR